MDFTFLVWLFVAIIQISLFSMYLIKMNKWGKEEIISETVDIIPICNYNGKAYWLDQGDLYRETSGIVTMNKSRAEKIDQLNSKDLSPVEVIYILELLEESK